MIGLDITSMSRREIFARLGCGDAVYRLYDASEVLLYVGVAGGVDSRFAAHSRKKSWWPEVAHRTAVWYGTRIEALSFEALAIDAEKPIHNLRKDRPLPIKADGLPGGWIHMIPEITVRVNLDSILTAMNRHNLTIGVAAKRTQACRAILVPVDWYRTAVAVGVGVRAFTHDTDGNRLPGEAELPVGELMSAIGEAAIYELERQIYEEGQQS